MNFELGPYKAALLLVIFASSAGVALAQDEPATRSQVDRIDRRLEAVRDELIEVRRDLHRHPEVSGQEERTAGVVSARKAATDPGRPPLRTPTTPCPPTPV